MDERELVSSAQCGDIRAFNQLVEAFQEQAFNLAYRILGDEETAADATQDAFLSAFRAIDRFRGGSFKSWILQIVTNSCYDQLRVLQRHPRRALEDLFPGPEQEMITADPGELPEEYVLRQELGTAIQRALGAIPAEQRVAIVLSDIQGLDYHDVAQVIGVSVGTVKSRVSRGRARLREHLMAHGELLPAPYSHGGDQQPRDEGTVAVGLSPLRHLGARRTT